MAERLLEQAVTASGAVPFRIDSEMVSFSNETKALGLPSGQCAMEDFTQHLAPADQVDFVKGLQSKRLDLRVRYVTRSGGVRYLRFIGEREGEGAFTGLVLPAGQFSRDQLDRETRVADAVSDGEILAYYQPIVSLETRRLAGFEALARWDKPGFGILGPEDFLGLADDLDLLSAIGESVRAAAARDLAAWRSSASTAPLFVAANASVSELLSKGFVDQLSRVVSAAGLRIGTYKLEISETEIMKEPERAAAAIGKLRRAGIQVALDDFGTGYSSLSRLDQFNFDTVKIDRYFVRAMESSLSAAKVVESVLQLAKHLGMTAVAEGIESESVAERLTQLGCDYGQGFHFSGALAPELAARIVGQGLKDRIKPPV